MGASVIGLASPAAGTGRMRPGAATHL